MFALGVGTPYRSGDTSKKCTRDLTGMMPIPVPSPEQYWERVELRHKYRVLLDQHAAKAGLPINTSRITHYLDSLLPLPGRLYRVSFEKKNMLYPAVHDNFDDETYMRRHTDRKHVHVGVSNPVTQAIDWAMVKVNSNIAGVFNPITGKTEWSEVYAKWGIAGVFNPYTGQVEWKKYRNGYITGWFNPITTKTEWNAGKGNLRHHTRYEILNPK